ncbi:rab9 effector protein with kelch motifs-like [Hylaeus volcanicus]|uniref:rab9 effector protein with kelch motifs-like n=1 Tax=Hylaeus volcanicus TaxID=313075 RepID=UPI0023B7E798|nr:rab9 effector protein with kelch motifs-like [Hylaeus volcanicus]XP_053992753.1 rab9 effector protein with kelch motifs-like [Hylaeus volcanicus]
MNFDISNIDPDPVSSIWSNPNIAGDSPEPRAAHSTNLINENKVYLFGGWNGKKALNDLYVIDVETMQCTQLLSENTPSIRNNHAAVSVVNDLYIHGGHNGVHWLDDFYVFNTQTMVWREISMCSRSPGARSCHTLSRVKDNLYMFGGHNGSQFFNDIEIFSLHTMTWTQLKTSGQPPPSRNSHVMSVLDTKLFLFGGYNANRYFTEIHIFDTETLCWSTPIITGTIPVTLRGHTASVVNDWIFIFGGYDGYDTSNRIYIFDTINLKWNYINPTEETPIKRQKHTACIWRKHHVLLFGGFTGHKWLSDWHLLNCLEIHKAYQATSSVSLMSHHIRKLLGTSVFSDVSLEVKGKCIPAHKCILAARCPYFKNHFMNTLNNAHQTKVVLTGISYPVLCVVLEYLYSGNISNYNYKVIYDTIKTCHQWKLEELKVICAKCMQRYLNSKNVFEILIQANKYKANDLVKTCLNFILDEANDVIKTGSSLRNDVDKAATEITIKPTLTYKLTRFLVSHYAFESSLIYGNNNDTDLKK